MKILLDTNIVIDHALQREPFWDASEQVLAAIEQKQIEGYISVKTVATRAGDRTAIFLPVFSAIAFDDN